MIAVVVLRPEPGATATARRARALGLAATVAPLFRVVPVPWTPPDEAVDALMLTSANAVRHAGPGLAAYRQLPAWVVGEATAAAARQAGLAKVRVTGPDAAALVAAVPSGLAILHLAGREHRAALPPAGLRRIVYASDAVERLPQEAADAMGEGAVALLHSPRAAALLRALAPDPPGFAIAALSPAVAEAAGAGWSRVIVAPAPTDEALLRAVCAVGDCA